MTLPPIASPAVDPKTGRLTDEWYSFLEELLEALREADIVD